MKVPVFSRFSVVLALTAVGFFFWSGGVAAAEMVDPLSSTYLVKLVVSLLLVIGLMFLVVWLLKRTGRFDGRAGRYPMRVLTQMSIGQRERVILIEVGDRQMLLGVAGGCVEPLGWVDPPISPDQDLAQTAAGQTAFGQLLQRQLDRRKNTAPEPREPKVDADVLDRSEEDLIVPAKDDRHDRG